MAKQQPSLTELRVGIFVVLVSFIAAVAIFTIGAQVGMFEEQFMATTYLSNVSGLKPGDVVLLGGVEVGNVTDVRIAPPGELPPTEQNVRILQRVARLMDDVERLETQIRNAEARWERLREERRQKEATLPADHPEVAQALERERAAAAELDRLRNRRKELLQGVEEERAGLQNVAVDMRINAKYRDWIRADSKISLGSIGLLGDKYIEISLGRSDEPPQIVRRTRETWIGEEEYEVVVVTGIQQASFAELITGANDILANFKTLSDQVEEIVRAIGGGEGTIGRFLTDEAFYDNLTKTVASANVTMERISRLVDSLDEGSGTIARLVQDDTLHQRLVGATENLEALLAKINEGQGTAGRFVNDPTLYDNTNATLANLKEITQDLKEGEGTLGKLMTDEELYRSLSASINDLSEVLKEIQEGRGTLGKLSRDESLYQNLNEVSSELVKLLYDFRQDPKKFLTIKFELF